MKHPYLVVLQILILIILSGCSIISQRQITAPNYYVLDYLSSTENRLLKQSKPFDKTLEVMDTKLPRTYNRSQLVKKISYSQITYFPNELWANRLYDAISNIIVQRLTAYNIFRKVSRDLGDVKPDFYLETYVHNIEYIESDNPQAFIRIELYLRRTSDQSIVFSQRNERMQPVRDKSISYLVQCYNQMIMFEIDIFAAKCIDFLSGKTIRDSKRISDSLKKNYEDYHLIESIDSVSVGDIISGELVVPLRLSSEVPLPFTISYHDTTNDEIISQTANMNEIIKLKPGKYSLILGSNADIIANVNILPNMRTVVDPNWGELVVHIIDQSQNKVRMQYTLYRKTSKDDFFSEKIGTRFSAGDEIGETDHIWVIKPGEYMITLQGVSPNALRDFTTVTVLEEKSYIMTMIVNPLGTNNILVGAGLLESSESNIKRSLHRGAVHADISFASNNFIYRDKPTTNLSLTSQFDNKLEYDRWPIHIISKSLYDIGFSNASDSEFKINVDDYSLKNSVVFYPWKKNIFLKNFGFYGRGDVYTHFVNDYLYSTIQTDFMKISQQSDTLLVKSKKIQITQVPYPLSLKEGSGLTYRWNLTPTVSFNFRTGYGWRQEYQKNVYSYAGKDTLNGIVYQVYKENPSLTNQGFEGTIILSAVNLLDFLSITSTLDVLFPRRALENNIIYYNENLLSIKLFRNISLDIKANIKYDKQIKDYFIQDYNAYLRLSLYY